MLSSPQIAIDFKVRADCCKITNHEAHNRCRTSHVDADNRKKVRFDNDKQHNNEDNNDVRQCWSSCGLPCDIDRAGNGGNHGFGKCGCNNDVRVGRCSSSFEDVTSALKSNTTTTTMNNDDDNGNHNETARRATPSSSSSANPDPSGESSSGR